MAFAAWACGVLACGCGESHSQQASGGSAQELLEVQKQVDPNLFRVKRAKGKGYDDVSLQDRRRILNEERKRMQDQP